MVKAEREFFEAEDLKGEDLERGRAWLAHLGLVGKKWERSLDLSGEQWAAMEGAAWEEGITFLREDQLFLLLWMFEEFRELIEQ